MSAYNGIDTVRWGGAIRGLQQNESELETHTTITSVASRQVRGQRTIFKLPRTGATAIIAHRADRYWQVRLEASLPKIKTPHSNLAGLSYAEALEAMEVVEDEADEYFYWLNPWPHRELARVDTMADFHDVVQRERLFRTLAHRSGTLVWQDSDRGGCTTIGRRSSRRSRMTMYDKYHEVLAQSRYSKHPAREIAIADLDRASGVVRAELRLLRPELHRLHWIHLADLNDAALEEAHRAAFYEAGFGATIAHMSYVLSALHESELGQGEARTTLYYLVCEYLGVVPELSNRTVRKCRSAARKVGVVPEALANDLQPVRLNYSTGRLEEVRNQVGDPHQ